MALCIPASRGMYRITRNIVTSIFNLRNNNFHDRVFTMEEDTLDDFTSQLIQKKVEKWSTRKSLPHNITVDLAPDNSKDKFSFLNTDKINELFQQAIDNNNNNNVLQLMQECIFHKICPSLSNLLYSLGVCSQTGDITTIKSIQKLCKEFCPEVLHLNSNFNHYIAEAIWIRGDANRALNLFKEVYKENTYLRRRVRLMLKNLIVDIVTNRSEAVLVNVVNFSEDLVKEYKDFYPLMCIWQVCFLSEWFTDQILALDLLKRYNELCKVVINRIPYVVAISLHNHRTEVVYRLLETLLKFEMKMQYAGVLIALLDYQIHQKDIRRCLEIVKWSEQNNIELLPIHHQKYLKLLINYKEDKNLIKKPQIVKPSKSKTDFKF